MRARLGWVTVSMLMAFACGPPEVTVLTPMSVLNWSPHDGAIGIALGSEPSVCLSVEIDEDTLDNASLRIEEEEEPGVFSETEVECEVKLSSADSRCIVFRDPGLQAATTYFMVLEPALQSVEGVSLGMKVSSRFTTVGRK